MYQMSHIVLGHLIIYNTNYSKTHSANQAGMLMNKCAQAKMSLKCLTTHYPYKLQ
jgi:hypothetical protein